MPSRKRPPIYPLHRKAAPTRRFCYPQLKGNIAVRVGFVTTAMQDQPRFGYAADFQGRVEENVTRFCLWPRPAGEEANLLRCSKNLEDVHHMAWIAPQKFRRESKLASRGYTPNKLLGEMKMQHRGQNGDKHRNNQRHNRRKMCGRDRYRRGSMKGRVFHVIPAAWRDRMNPGCPALRGGMDNGSKRLRSGRNSGCLNQIQALVKCHAGLGRRAVS